MEERGLVKPSPPLPEGKNCRSCQPVHFVFLFSVLTSLAGITIIVWWTISSDNEPISIDIVSRSTWESKPVRATSSRPLCINPPNFVVIMDTYSDRCFTLKDCSNLIRTIQTLDRRQQQDISYNFLIGNDGRVYEGRGWGSAGSYSNLVNDKSIGIAVIGNYENNHPSQKILEVCQKFIEEGVRRKKLDPNYKLIALRQVSSPRSPGKNLFNIIKGWQHWTNCEMKGCSRKTCNGTN